MAFFIITKKNVTNYEFPYLLKADKPKLADTQIHGEVKVHKFELDKLSRDVYASEIMSKQVRFLSPADKMSTVNEVMNKENIHHIPLEVDNRLVGLISLNDLRGGKPSNRAVDYMSRTLLCSSEYTPLRHIVSVFMHENVHCLPVINEDFKVVGIITDNDIYSWMLENSKCSK